MMKNTTSEVKLRAGESSKVKRVDDKAAGKVDKPFQMPSQESERELPVDLNSKEADLKMSSEVSLIKISELKAETQLMVPVKKRNTQRKARQYNTSESKNKSKSKGQCKQATGNSTGIDDVKPNNQGCLWFTLVPAKDENGNGFPQLDKMPHLCLKDYSASVSTFQKYLKLKMNLEDESEVEISCRGKKLDPSMNLYGIKMHWIDSLFQSGLVGRGKEWTDETVIIELVYSRRISSDA